MKIYAHRGSSGENPEMTRTAYEAAIQDGADGFECDVRLSKDGEIVCIHDATTRRIAGRRKRVSRSNLKELQGVHGLITLNELLDLAILAKKDLLIETKHPNIFGGSIEGKVVELLNTKSSEIKEAGIEVTVMSFSSLAIWRIGSKWQSCKVSKYYLSALLSRTPSVALSIDLLRKYPSLANRIRGKNSRLLLWTVNEKTDIEFCRSLNVFGLITDFPRIARSHG
jgi:glycerophosphoryl diester phosphodiesterase